MKKPNKFNFLTLFNIVLTLSIIFAGICLIYGCISIYTSGDGYSREIISNTFSKISIPIYVCLGLIVTSITTSFLFSDTGKKQKFIKPKNFKQNKVPKLNNKTQLIIKASVITVGIGLIIVGAITGGFTDVLTKAVNICTECIGLG